MSMTNKHQEMDPLLRIQGFFQTPIEVEAHRITLRFKITEVVVNLELPLR